METIDKIKQTAKEKGISISFLCDKVGMQRTYLNDVQKRNGTIPEDRLKTIAECLNVSTDYLLGNTDDPTPPGSQHEVNIVRVYLEDGPQDFRLSAGDIKTVLRMLQALDGKE